MITMNHMSVFYDGYRERNPIKWLKRYFRHWKWAYQRATRGYADCDTWDIRGWFFGVMPAMLDQMAEEAHGFPAVPGDSSFTTQAVMMDDASDETDRKFKEWQTLLHYMATKFRDADEDMCSMKNPYEDEWSKAYDEFSAEYGWLGEKLEEEAIREKKPSIRMHFPDEFPQWKDIMDKYREEELEIAKFRTKSLDEAMELFHKWFWDLWD